MFGSFQVVQDERDYLQLFERDQLIYLSPESTNILHTLDFEKVWNFSLSRTLSHSLTLTHSFSLSLSFSLSHTLSHSLTLTHSFSLSLSFSLSHTLSHSLTLTYSFSFSLSRTLSHSLTFMHSFSFSHSHTHSQLSLHLLSHFLHIQFCLFNLKWVWNYYEVYIIGGLVDHNRLKGFSFKKASTQGIATAKLPVNQYIERFANISLNVNHGLFFIHSLSYTHSLLLSFIFNLTRIFSFWDFVGRLAWWWLEESAH
jgi:hypothetical protein